jgi:hypothetical protein
LSSPSFHGIRENTRVQRSTAQVGGRSKTTPGIFSKYTAIAELCGRGHETV